MTAITSRPRRIAATALAQAPVPQASVSPLPRSQTRICRILRSITRINSVLTPSGKISAFSNFGPTLVSSRLSGSSQNTTQCGFPMDTQVISHSFPSIGTGLPIISLSGSATGIRSGASSACPIFTVTPVTCPSFTCICRTRIPLLVSTAISSFLARPLSYRYLPTQRIPLPHILPSLPS